MGQVRIPKCPWLDVGGTFVKFPRYGVSHGQDEGVFVRPMPRGPLAYQRSSLDSFTMQVGPTKSSREFIMENSGRSNTFVVWVPHLGVCSLRCDL